MLRLLDGLMLSWERLWQQRALALWVLVGLAAATLALSLTLYVDAVNRGLLESRLAEPPYAFRLRYLGSWNGNITREDVTSATAAIEGGFAATMGLPTERAVSYARGSAWAMRREDGQALGAFSLGTLKGADDQMEIMAGEWINNPHLPSPSPFMERGSESDAISVLIPEKMLYAMGLQVGDMITATPAGGQPITLQVTALWRPVDDKGPAWIFPPTFFDQIMLVQEADLWRALEGMERPVEEGAWYLSFDGESVRTSDVNSLLGRIADGTRDVTAALPGIRLDLAPTDGLNAFNIEVQALTQQLVIMIAPVGGLVLYFVSLVAGLLVSRQQGEDAILRSRGMSRMGVLGIHAQMWLLLAGAALAVGIGLSPLVVRLVGQTTSFMRFDDLSRPLDAMITPQAILIGAATALLAASSGLFLAWRAGAQTITSFKRGNARSSQAWWQRAYLDVLLLIPAGYALYTLSRGGQGQGSAENPFDDPLTFIGPTLFSFGLTLLFLRLWPLALRLSAGLVSYGRGLALLMALRELTRSIGRYRGTLLLMCFTLSLSGFTASMASTLDRSLKDTMDYRIGADAVMVTLSDAQTEEETSDDGSQTTTNVTGFNALPADDLLTIEGVTAVSRVGHYEAQLILASQRIEGTLLGIDRAAMAAVTRFRPDYADEDAADLFNQLAENRGGVLISERAAVTYNLRIGQEITLQVYGVSEWFEMKAPILGVVEYFPTLDPNAGFFAIGNIEPIFEYAGSFLPYDYWLSLAPGTDSEAVRQEAAAKGYPINEWRDPEAALRAAMAAPARRGVLGFLSVGFVASILLTLIAAVIQSAASFRAQAAQLGSLRAMGLGGGTVGAYLTLVQGMSAAGGIASGTSIGVATTLLFLPLLDFSGGLPPYLVRVAWDQIALVYGVFAGILLAVTLVMTALLGRERLSAVVKLGDG